MKIAIIGTAHPFRGGLSAFNERLAKEFIAEGHSVTMFTFTLQYPNFLFPGKTQYTDDPAPEGLKIIRCINSVNPFNWIKVGLKLRKEKFDAVVFCYWMSFMAPCFGTIARVIGKKSKRIALIHNLIPHEKTILDTFLPGYFVRSMNGFTAMAQSVLDEITALDNKNKPKNMTPHPMYDHFGKPMDKNDALTFLGLSDENHYILFFGLVRAYKGLDLLLK